ncbi:WXG100 family type VII secretion target [Streptomyces sulphureus]|uniref:WXG100 family type VII secretion target n=1 Tax=Streptomyces sulphureus TaxID=47758 RepID=UPI0003721CCA|nr:WXG100 family type VII secretion target [Streptomyces sulphureus]
MPLTNAPGSDAGNLTDGIIDVHYSEVENAAMDIVAQTKAIKDTLHSLDEELKALREGWNGDDRAAYEQAQAKWNGAVDQMQMLLTKNQDLLQEVAQNHQRDERSGAQGWSEVTPR